MAAAGASGSGSGDQQREGGAPVPTLDVGGALGFESPAEHVQKIHDVVEPLRVLGVPVDIFTVEAILNAGFTVDQFLKQTRVLTAHADMDAKGAMLQLGVIKKFFTLPQLMLVDGFIRLLKFLRSKRRKLKLLRKAGPEGRPELAALVEAFNVQHQKMASRVKDLRKGYERRISAHRKCVRMLEAERDKEIDVARQKNMPASSFEELCF